MHHPFAGGQLLPDGRAGIVAGKDRRAVRGERAEHAAVLSGGGLGAIHEFLVLALGIQHQRHLWAGHGGQTGNLAGVVHAHFHHTHAMGIGEAQQRERHADVVVEIAACGKGRLLAHVGNQNGGDHFLDGGLAVAAGDGNERQAEACTPAGRQRAQRQPGIGHPQGQHTGALEAHFGGDTGCAGRDGGIDEIVPVETLAAQGDVQITGRTWRESVVTPVNRPSSPPNTMTSGSQEARFCRSNMGVSPAGFPGMRVSLHGLGGAGGPVLLQGGPGHVRIGEGMEHAGDFLGGFPPLAGNQHHVGRSASAMAASMAARRSTSVRQAGAFRPAATSAMMRCGSSSRGLSLVTTTRSARASTA